MCGLPRTIAMLILDFMNFEASKHSITRDHKGSEVTALVQAGLEVFLPLFALMGKKDCFLFPINQFDVSRYSS